eukprot:TRINITY_DN9898_c0_g1_i1.p1 TRINITY_DN9898_c0_g1~~TRINITY_DN9898_c0_g1_i1.p1  ORF type:complete len:830 (-),score=75.52 TRINITY_DN9898_c0_g1_i1:154-2598(-)
MPGPHQNANVYHDAHSLLARRVESCEAALAHLQTTNLLDRIVALEKQLATPTVFDANTQKIAVDTEAPSGQQPEKDAMGSSTVLHAGAHEAFEVIEEPPKPSRKHTSVMCNGATITKGNLDHGDMVVITESVWSCCLFAGSDSIGWLVSLELIFNMMMSAGLQLLFIYIVWHYMLDEDPVAESRLDSLLRFRATVGHDAGMADANTGESLVSRLCNGDYSLHLAGSQFALYDSLVKFKGGGRILANIAIVCWMLAILKELMTIVHLSRAILHIESGRTQFTVDDGYRTDKREMSSEELLKIAVVARLTSMSRCRKICIHAFVLMPRLIIAIALGWVGAQFLAITADMTELILNAVALNFVLDIDEMLYDVFVPRRAHAMLANLQPLHLPPAMTERWTAAGVHFWFKAGMAFAVIAAINISWLDPFFGRIDQAAKILCTGNTHFVAYPNPSTGVVEATVSSELDDGFQWKPRDYSVLEMAHPELQAKFGWNPSEGLLQASRLTNHSGRIIPVGSALTGEFQKFGFREIRDLMTASAEELSRREVCLDEYAAGSKSEFRRIARLLSGNSSVSSCQDVAHLCNKLEFNAVRQLCPFTCGCIVPFENSSRSGMFTSSSYGCVEMCTTLWRRMNEDFMYASNTSYACVDTPVRKWVLNGTGLRFTDSFRIYLRSVFEYVQAIPNIKLLQKTILTEWADGVFPGFNPVTADLDDIIASMEDGRALADLEAGIWRTARGLPISGLEGCDFFASLSVRAFWGVDLCADGSTLGIRLLCPESCGCRLNKGLPGCPLTCSRGPVRFQPPWICEDSDCPPPGLFS